MKQVGDNPHLFVDHKGVTAACSVLCFIQRNGYIIPLFVGLSTRYFCVIKMGAAIIAVATQATYVQRHTHYHRLTHPFKVSYAFRE